MLQNQQLFSGIDELRVLWAYGIDQKLYSTPLDGVNIQYIEGLPTAEDLSEKQ
ncbi:hypothetical protein B4U80_04929, partial [Leptotrombidium deliense]